MKILLTLLAVGLMQFAYAKDILLTSKNTVIMNQPFRASSVSVVQQKLANLARETKEDLYLVLNSPGGSITAGQTLIDFANGLPNKVHTVTIFAASMAYLTVQHLDKRYIIKSGTMMSHRARIAGLAGQVPGEAMSRLKYIHSIVEDLLRSTAKRVGVSYDEYLDSIYDGLWLTSNQAVKLNHADEVVNAKCDKSLSGTYTTKVNTLFGLYEVVFSKCPLISAPVKIKTDNKFIKQLIKRTLNHIHTRQFEFKNNE